MVILNAVDWIVANSIVGNNLAQHNIIRPPRIEGKTRFSRVVFYLVYLLTATDLTDGRATNEGSSLLFIFFLSLLLSEKQSFWRTRERWGFWIKKSSRWQMALIFFFFLFLLTILALACVCDEWWWWHPFAWEILLIQVRRINSFAKIGHSLFSFFSRQNAFCVIRSGNRSVRVVLDLLAGPTLES